MTAKGAPQEHRVLSGQSLIEYGLMLTLIAIFCVSSFQVLGQNLSARIYNEAP